MYLSTDTDNDFNYFQVKLRVLGIIHFVLPKRTPKATSITPIRREGEDTVFWRLTKH